jgi:adenylosuccinate synthase
METILLLSGPIAVGKSTLAATLIGQHGFHPLKSSHYLRDVCRDREIQGSRASLQDLGDRLDIETDYRWLVDAVARPQLEATPSQSRWLIDSVRKERQIEHFRAAFGGRIRHLHVWAPEDVLRQRYQLRFEAGEHAEGGTSYEEAISHSNETSARGLKEVADLAANLARFDTSTLASAVVAALSPSA